MTQRLPIPGSDNGTWGSILNGFLEVSHNSDGTLIPSALTQAGAATLSSPSFTGTPTAPTASPGSNTTQLATTAFTTTAIGGLSGQYAATSALAAEIAARKAPAFNLEDFGTVDTSGTTDMTTIMTNAVAAAAGGKLLLPPGIIMCGDVPGVSSIIIEGAGDRSTTLLAKTGCTNVLNFQNKGKCYFRDFGVNSNSIATYGININWGLTGASTANIFERIYTYGATTAGLTLGNNGDSYVVDCGGTDVLLWNDPGGNVIIVRPKYLSTTNGSTPLVQICAQNALISGGTVWGIAEIDATTTLNLVLESVYLYAPSGGGACIAGPTTSGKIDSLVARGGEWGVSDSTESFFSGNWGYGLKIDGVYLNSGATSGTPMAFASNFTAAGANPLLIEIGGGSILQANAGANGAVWNDKLNFTGTMTGTSNQITAIASLPAGVAVGQTVQASGFVTGTTVSSISNSGSPYTVTVSNNASASVTETITAGIPNIHRIYRNFVGWDTNRDFIDNDSLGQIINIPNSLSYSALSVQVAGQPQFQIRRGAAANYGLVLEGLNGLVPSYNSLQFSGTVSLHSTSQTANYSTSGTTDLWVRVTANSPTITLSHETGEQIIIVTNEGSGFVTIATSSGSVIGPTYLGPGSGAIYVSDTTNYRCIGSWNDTPPGALAANTWYPNYALTLSTLQLIVGKIYAYPLVVPASHTFQSIGLWVTTAGVTSVLRFGIFADNGGTPVGGALILDAGTVNGNTSAAAASTTISQLLTPGVYWLVVVNNSAGTPSTVQTDGSARLNGVMGQTGLAAAQAQSTGYQSSATTYTGALPATFPAGTVGGTCPLVMVEA